MALQILLDSVNDGLMPWSTAAALAMVFKLVESAQERWQTRPPYPVLEFTPTWRKLSGHQSRVWAV
nr:hypothetical protein OG781_16975 [Streptomyces sp. NBC_00830]